MSASNGVELDRLARALAALLAAWWHQQAKAKKTEIGTGNTVPRRAGGVR